MKLRPSAPLTNEDEEIWFRVHLLLRVVPLRPVALIADRRDAALMYWLSNFGERHYARLPRMPRAARLPAVHLWLRIDAEFPTGHHLIDLT